MQLDFKERVLSKLGEGKVRRMNFLELREATGISYGIVAAVWELRSAGKVYWDGSNEIFVIDNATVISLCSVIVLGGERRLTVLAPDEAESLHDGEAIWKILVHTRDPVPVEFTWWSTISFYSLYTDMHGQLYHLISSGLVDETAERVEQELKCIFDEYHARST